MPEVVYSSTVTAVGALVADFREQGLLVWFGENAPEELHEFSILHRVDNHKRAPIVGDRIALNDDYFTVLAVGSVASENLLNLGHLDLKANGLSDAELPGDVNVEARELPMVKVGDRLQVIAQN
ncbi:MAG: PTS glucitol/sorbitol transporter subunit IIA [Actinobacteria bacterium]|nr:PTS glucitol/sorbitol transporter subunit IIA [Actinomycetota bacterium]